MRKIRKVLFTQVFLVVFYCCFAKAVYSVSPLSASIRPYLNRTTYHRMSEIADVSSPIYKLPLEQGDRIEISGKRFQIISLLYKGNFFLYKAVDLDTRESVILKFPFITVSAPIDTVKEMCEYEEKFFSKRFFEQKERIVRGYSLRDKEGNVLIVTRFIEGQELEVFLEKVIEDVGWKDYYKNVLPTLLQEFIEAIKTYEFILEEGFYHEFTPFNIMVEKESGKFIFRIFDYNYPDKYVVDLYMYPHNCVYKCLERIAFFYVDSYRGSYIPKNLYKIIRRHSKKKYYKDNSIQSVRQLRIELEEVLDEMRLNEAMSVEKSNLFRKILRKDVCTAL